MTGNIWAFGNFDQCLNINTKLLLPTLGTLEGQYCKALVPIINSNLELTGRADETQDLIGEVATNRQTRGPKLYLQSGVCIPKSCKPEQVTQMIGFRLIDCKVKKEVPLETLDYVAM